MCITVSAVTPTPVVTLVTPAAATSHWPARNTAALAPGTLSVKGLVPLSELNNYQARLNGMTGGEGRYTIAMSHYEAVPPTVQQQLMGQYKVKEED